MNPDFSKFLLPHQTERFKVKEFEHWFICVRDEQVTLGDLVFYLKRPEPSLAGLQPLEAQELPIAAKWFEESASRIFGAEKFNYIAAMMGGPFIHIHALARYSRDQEFAGRTWPDKFWPKPASMENLTTTDFELDAITNVYREQGK
jgi:diadenosine tetraphosphate (Ap4A) HIT family hydrolase